MNDSYLWDRSGEPDSDIIRLEKQLGRLRHGGPAPKSKTFWSGWLMLAAAVAVLCLISIPLYLSRPVTNWKMPNGHAIRAGQVIETGAMHQTKIQSDDTGEVTIDPHSRFRLVASSNDQQRFDLRRGTIHAFIWAPPGKFVVDTPSSKTIDLGCSYTLQVSENGNGLLNVEFGWVAFEKNNIESFIPAGAACRTRPKLGPGTPYFTDATAALQSALTRFDEGDAASLTPVIEYAGPHDALTLWHLLMRTKGDERAKVFDRFRQLVPLPAAVTRDAILSGNQEAIDASWNALGLGGADWWRKWKRAW